MSQQSVGMTRYVLSFALLYYLLMTGVGVIAMTIGARPAGWNILVLIIATTCIALWFIRRNRRTFSRSEYLRVVLGCVLVDVAMELGFMAMISGHIPTDKWAGMINILGGHALLIALGYSSWSWAVRSYAKRVGSS